MWLQKKKSYTYMWPKNSVQQMKGVEFLQDNFYQILMHLCINKMLIKFV